MKQVYLAHPFTNGMTLDPPKGTRNLERAKLWYAWCCRNYQATHHFNIMWLLDIEINNANNEGNGLVTETKESRQLGMELNFVRISSVDELWLIGKKVSRGMNSEAVFARRCGLPVYNLTTELSPVGLPRFPIKDMVTWKRGSLTEQVAERSKHE